jgi:hypothetical protein
MVGDIRADGLVLIGQARIDTAGEFASAVIERIFSRDQVDNSCHVNRGAAGG